ncbi:MAG TPA: hypothetical protein VHD35_08045 [Chitinophagaceae bacterium]|nr:hypothetical protein [Chitinophagaceae bacterium]
MEVHHHTHTERKKWFHYLWEFFMLFLAVSLGFFVENLREHHLESIREKQYMQSLLTDLKEDTAQVNNSFANANKAQRYEDSLIYFVYQHPPSGYLPNHYLDIDLYALLRLKVIFNEATAQQLKNSGSLRLIHYQNAARAISLYWNQQEFTKISLDRYLEYRNRGRQFEESLFTFSQGDLVDAGLIPPSDKSVKVLRSDPATWAEFSNIISHCHITLVTYLEDLKKVLDMAKGLIALIQKEYHLK